MGGLHIEQVALLKAHGSMIKCTALSDIIRGAGLRTIGLETAVNDVNNIKKARYSVQVIAPCIFNHLWNAYGRVQGVCQIFCKI